MGNVQFYDNKVLFNGGQVAMDPACCCSSSSSASDSSSSSSSTNPNICVYYWEARWDCATSTWGAPYQTLQPICTSSCVDSPWSYSYEDSGGCFWIHTKCSTEGCNPAVMGSDCSSPVYDPLPADGSVCCSSSSSQSMSLSSSQSSSSGSNDCAGGNPSIKLKVFDSDYDLGGSDIVWCGETWTPAQIRAGDERYVCPSDYSLRQAKTTTTSWSLKNYEGREFWRYGNSLRLSRRYFASQQGASTWRDGNLWFNKIQVRDPGVFSSTDYFIFRTTAAAPPLFPAGFTTKSASDLGILVGKVGTTINTQASYNDYLIPEAYFSSVTVGGVEYSWDRGLGW